MVSRSAAQATLERRAEPRLDATMLGRRLPAADITALKSDTATTGAMSLDQLDFDFDTTYEARDIILGSVPNMYQKEQSQINSLNSFGLTSDFPDSHDSRPAHQKYDSVHRQVQIIREEILDDFEMDPSFDEILEEQEGEDYQSRAQRYSSRDFKTCVGGANDINPHDYSTAVWNEATQKNSKSGNSHRNISSQKDETLLNYQTRTTGATAPCVPINSLLK